METKIDEIAPGIYRLSTLVAEIYPPHGFTFNQFLVKADEALLFHCGHRKMFPLVSAAVAKLMPVEKLRWITFGHYEPDESGAMNLWLAAAPKAQVAHGLIGCRVVLDDAADRKPRPLADGEVIDLGGRRVRHLDTPHVPHGWDARVLYEESTATLFCGDLMTHAGNGPAIVESDIVAPAIEADRDSGATCLTPSTAPTLRRLAQLKPKALAVMHGSSYRGDCAAALNALADDYASRVRASTESGAIR
jgi:flavorubredoxin